MSRNIECVQSTTVTFQNSTMARFALFVDVRIALPRRASQLASAESSDTADDRFSSGGTSAVLRFANVHLESLPVGAEARPEQLAIVSSKLNDASSQPELRGGVVAGDMNAIGESDVGLPAKCNLCDAFTGSEDDEQGFTWGYQPTCVFKPGRLDKILYYPGNGLEVVALRRVGVGLKAELTQSDATTKDEIWASDHFGLVADVQFADS